MFIYLFVFIIIVIVVFLFSSPKLSPVPYFPSQKTDLPKIIKALDLKNNQTIFDFGAGDGIVIFQAANKAFQQKLNTKFVAVEINPVLILVLQIQKLFHPNRKNIKIILADMFKINFPTIKQYNNITIYLYISPWFQEKVIENCKLKIENFSVISYMYPIGLLKNKEKIIQGKNKIFVYN